MNVVEIIAILGAVGGVPNGLGATLTGVAKLIESWKMPKGKTGDK